MFHAVRVLERKLLFSAYTSIQTICNGCMIDFQTQDEDCVSEVIVYPLVWTESDITDTFKSLKFEF